MVSQCVASYLVAVYHEHRTHKETIKWLWPGFAAASCIAMMAATFISPALIGLGAFFLVVFVSGFTDRIVRRLEEKDATPGSKPR